MLEKLISTLLKLFLQQIWWYVEDLFLFIFYSLNIYIKNLFCPKHFDSYSKFKDEQNILPLSLDLGFSWGNAHINKALW